jgi:hypothetical protein
MSRPTSARDSGIWPSTAALAAVAMLLPATPVAAGQTDAERLSQLEQMMRSLSERVAALEAATSTQATSTTDGDGIRWRFEPPVSGRPLAATQKHLDRRSGNAELLLEITAPLPDPSRWLNEDGWLPLVLVATHADGSEAAYPVQLARRTSLEPGSFLHVRAALDASEIARVVDILIRSERAAQRQPAALPQRSPLQTNPTTDQRP